VIASILRSPNSAVLKATPKTLSPKKKSRSLTQLPICATCVRPVPTEEAGRNRKMPPPKLAMAMGGVEEETGLQGIRIVIVMVKKGAGAVRGAGGCLIKGSPKPLVALLRNVRKGRVRVDRLARMTEPADLRTVKNKKPDHSRTGHGRTDRSNRTGPGKIDSSRIGRGKIDSSRIDHPGKIDSSRIGRPGKIDSNRIDRPGKTGRSRIGHPGKIDSSKIDLSRIDLSRIDLSRIDLSRGSHSKSSKSPMSRKNTGPAPSVSLWNLWTAAKLNCVP